MGATNIKQGKGGRHRRERMNWKIPVSLFFVLYSMITIFLVGETILSSFKTKMELVENLLGFPKIITLSSWERDLQNTLETASFWFLYR